MTTLVENILLQPIQDEKNDDSYLNFSEPQWYRKKSMDLFLPLETRLESLTQYYKLEGESVGELISTLQGMFFFSRTVCLKEYLISISSLIIIPLIYRIECAKCLVDDDDRIGLNNIGYDLINKMFETEDEMKKISVPIRVETVYFLMRSEKYMEQSREYFCNITADKAIENLYRFKIIQSLENMLHCPKGITFLYYAREASIRFLKNPNNFYTYRVIAGQYIFEKCSPTKEIIDTVENFLLEVALMEDLDEDVRADACDILLQYGDDNTRLKARDILFILGGGVRTNNNIFKNTQNVHIRSIEESVERIIKKLSEYKPKNKGLTFDKIHQQILDKSKGKNFEAEIKNAMIRIQIDRATYGHSNLTLVSILVKIWGYIEESEHREELENRLMEEIVESNNKCSSGYVGRLVNTLSGFDHDMSIIISFKDQIVANLEGRLNAKARGIMDDTFRDLVLEEMTVPVHHFDQRGNFLKFFRENISQIREEMYQEFKEFMDDSDYDMHFRSAIMSYEGYR